MPTAATWRLGFGSILPGPTSIKTKEKTMNQPNKPRTHLFSPHTDQCIYCGKSAEDDAIENTPCGSDQPVSCGACNGKGWLWCIAEGDHPPREEIQRCDAAGGSPMTVRRWKLW